MIADLPLVKLWTEAEEEEEDIVVEIERGFISYIVADILALASFDNSLDHLMLYYLIGMSLETFGMYNRCLMFETFSLTMPSHFPL